ncbi:MAG TPA: MFS transporter [Acidimicrobiales bacterium]|nr:MFS transporter [Acidimicrobiales bacterium]
MRGPAAFRGTFDALSVRNYRLYFWGQVVSVSGTWMQSVAQAWLVLKLSHSGVELGALPAIQFLPMLVAGPWGGLVADRMDKRRTLVGTQVAAGLLALTLGLLTQTGVVRVWMIFALAAGLGCVNAVDNPTRQTFVMEMVGPERLTNAVTLNSVVMNAARIVGPAIGGVLIYTVGIATCFLVNAASYVAVLAALMMMRRGELLPAELVARRKGQVLAGLRYVRATPAVRTPLLMIAVIGTLAYNFTVTLALLDQRTFHGGAGGYSAMTSIFGAGAVVGGLLAASRGKPTGRRLGMISLAFGSLLVLCALMPNMPAELAALAVMGAFSITFIATANTTLQLTAAPEMRGRVMALYAVAFLGSTPIGSPIVGWVSETFGPRVGIGLGGVATVVTALVALPSLTGTRRMLLRRRRRVGVIAPVEPPVPAPEDAVAAL